MVRTSMRRRSRREHGITVVFFAIALSAMLTLGALVLGGSVGYTAARNAQTAADAAALAGASALQNHKQDWTVTSAADVLAEVTSVAAENGAALERCELVAAEYALNSDEAHVLGDCSALENLPDATFKRTAGVRVSVADTRNVPLAGFVDRDEITGRAVAAATAQPVGALRSPFMLCGEDGVHEIPPIIPDPNDPSAWSVNPGAIGKDYALWGNAVKEGQRDCGNPNSRWRGLVDFSRTFQLPSPNPDDDTGWWEVRGGNASGITNAVLPSALIGADGCTIEDGSIASLTLGCRILVPICPKSNLGLAGADEFKLYCTQLGLFEITKVKLTELDVAVDDLAPAEPCVNSNNPIVCGRMVDGGGIAAYGEGVALAPDRNSVVVVKLVE